MEQYGEHQFVEELPFELEEESEKSRSCFCFRLWQNRCEYRKDPVRSIHLGTHAVLFEMVVELRQMLFHEEADAVCVLLQPRKISLENVS